jgi:hypothetical protein
MVSQSKTTGIKCKTINNFYNHKLKTMKKLFVFSIILVLAAFVPKKKLVGRWETRPSEKGNVTGVIFYKDHTYEAYVNKKPFVSGKFSLRRNTITIEETGCNGAKGVYKLIFYSGSDSLRFEPISDTCSQRRGGMSRTILGRVK